MVVETLSLDTINANSLQSLQQTLQTMQRLRVGTERVRSWYGAGLASVLSFGTSSPPSPSENGRFGVYHRGQNRYHDST